MRFFKSLVLAVLLFSFIYYTTTNVLAFNQSLLFYDGFGKPVIDTVKWQIGPGTVNFYPAGGSISTAPLNQDSSSTQFTGLYSNTSFDSRAGRSYAAFMRTLVLASYGPYLLFSADKNFQNPLLNSTGTGFHRFFNEPFSHYWIWYNSTGGRFLRAVAIINGKVIPYGNAVVEGIDHLVVTTLRNPGSFHFISGGVFGNFPQATLIWVNDNPVAARNYLGIQQRWTYANIFEPKLLDLERDFVSDYGLAKIMDSFNRLDSSALGNTETGNAAWSSSNMKISSSKLVRENTQASSSASVNSGISEGIFELKLHTPEATPAATAFYFRKQDENNWWRVVCSDSTVTVEKNTAGVVTIAYQPDRQKDVSCKTNTDYRLVVRAHDKNIGVWLNDEIVTPDEGINDDFLSNATNTGVGFDEGFASSEITRIVVWPKTVNLPNELGPFPTVPQALSDVIIYDNFNDINGKRLKDHIPDQGGMWREDLSSWVINNGKAIPQAPNSTNISTIDSGSNDHAIDMTINLSGGDELVNATNYDGWEIGPVIRYQDSRNYVWARYLWQQASPEIEVWEVVNGNTKFLNAKNIKGFINPGETHTLRAVVLGKKIAIYTDGKLVEEAETSILSGTRVGMVMDFVPIKVSSVESFTVTKAGTDINPPTAVGDLSYSISSSQIFFSFTPVNDDASGVKFYRVYRSTDGSVGTQINKDGETKTTPYIDSSNPPTGKYYYTIRAVDNAGNENTSSLNKQISVDYTYVHPSPPGPTLPIPVNLVLNSSFETVSGDFAANWPRQNSTWRDTNNKKSGVASFGVMGPASGTSLAYTYQTPQLVPNTKYVLSGWIKTNNVTGDGVSIRYAQTNPNVVIYQTQTLRLTNNWTYVSTTFTTPNDFQSGRLDILWNLKPGDMAFVDDVKLERITYPNLVKNPSFESLGTNGYPADWWYRPSALKDSLVKRTGAASLKIFGSADYTYSQQHIALKPSTYYQLNYWIKTNNVSGNGISMRYPVLDPANRDIFYSAWTYGTTNWRKITSAFITPVDYKSGRLDIWWKLNAGDTAWIDDVSLCERECL